MLNAILCGTSTEKLEAIFRICDVNGNGFIEKQELIHIIQVKIFGSFPIVPISFSSRMALGRVLLSGVIVGDFTSEMWVSVDSIVKGVQPS